jgi:biopolymer transport protein ExbD
MLISAVIISIISFGISRINFTDYKSFNESILKNNIAYTYNLKLPKSNISHQIEDRSITSNLWIVNDKNSQQPKLFFDTTRYYINGNISEIKFKDLSTALYHKHNNLPDYYAFSTSITLLIDTSIKMKFVNQVLDKIYLSGFYRINYATRPIEDNNHRSPVDFKVITEPLFYRKNLQSQSYHDIPPPPPPPPSFQNQNSNLMAIELSINSRGDYTINNKAIKHKEVKNKLKSLILSSNYKYKIKLQIYSDISFGEYFDAKQIIHKAVMELRDEYCMKKYKKSFHDIWYLDNGYEIQKSLMKKIRYTLHEEFDGE